MLPKAENTVFRAAGIHAAIPTINRRNKGPVAFNEQTEGVQPMIRLPLGAFPRTILTPWRLKRRGVDKGGKGEKENEEGSCEKYVKAQMPKYQNLCLIIWILAVIR